MKKHFIITVLMFLCSGLFAQTVTGLISGYTGTAEWDDASKTLTFVTSGQITFPDKGNKSWLWEIPTDVKKIFIQKDIRVNGAFHSKASVTIEGEDRKTSVVYGTDEQRWADNRGIKAYTICSFQNFGGTMTIKNLTSLNPRGFHVRGWGKKMMVSYCDFIDDRDGHGNHSDGVEGGDGSVFDNCYFETGDDIFKVYFDILVTNCVVNMITNTVPIQLGWGDYSNGKTGTFRNLTIYGNSGRGAQGNPIINGRRGTFNVTVNIDGCDIENPNASWVTLTEANTGLNCNVTNAKINVKSHVGKYLNGPYTFSICGSNEQLNQYNCAISNSVQPKLNKNRSFIYPNPVHKAFLVDAHTDVIVYDGHGHKMDVVVAPCQQGVKVNVEHLPGGLYFVKTGNETYKFLKQ